MPGHMVFAEHISILRTGGHKCNRGGPVLCGKGELWRGRFRNRELRRTEHGGNDVPCPAGGDFYSMRDVLSWTKGPHAIKMGGELSYNKTVQDTLLNNYGVYTFNNSVTKNALASTNP